MTAFIGLPPAPPPLPPGGQIVPQRRGTMTTRGEPNPDGGAAYVGFDNEHGAAVREILQTTGDYWAKVDEETPLLELPPFTREEI